MTESAPVLTREEQQQRFGIDCGDAIVFGGGTWSPGGEHIHRIIVKNVSKQTIKFKYQLPKTKFFSMDFPELITLSPGTHRTLNISFRPVMYEPYDDYVSFQVFTVKAGVKTNGGSFRLPVQANIAVLQAKIPSILDFALCPTAETTTQTFHLENTGQLHAAFQWILPQEGPNEQPFQLEPSQGEIAPGQIIQVVASFSPESASVFEASICCRISEIEGALQSEEKVMTIKGIGKYTYLSISQAMVDFGDMPIGVAGTEKRPTERTFELRNPSLVRATFHVENVESDHQPLFHFSPLQGILEPGKTILMRVRYTPISNGDFTCDNFDIKTPGGHSVRITCKGRAIGPSVSIWKKNQASNFIDGHSLNFQDVEIGKSATRVAILRNASKCPATFHFMLPQNAVFELDKVNGIIPPLLEVGIIFTFRPTKPENYYRRVFCLILNQSPIHIDILGTGYDARNRPSPFQQAHIEAFRLRKQRNLQLMSPDNLDDYLKKHGSEVFLDGALARQKRQQQLTSQTEEQAQITRSGEAQASDVKLCHEFFIDSCDPSGEIVLQELMLDFGGCSIASTPEKKVFHVTNRTQGKVMCSWTVSATEGVDQDVPTQNPIQSFEVFPASEDINPGKTVAFRVNFRPHLDNTYYFAQLEAHVSFKSNRTFRLVNEQTFTPPWCVVLSVYGNTFGSFTQQFLPKLKLPSAIYFPACHLGDSVFQTFLLTNSGDTPVQFYFPVDPNGIFALKPRCGIIRANSFHLIQARFTPKRENRYRHVVQCQMNNVQSKTMEIELIGTGCLPHLQFGNTMHSHEPVLHIKPTSVGLTSEREFIVHNVSRIPLLFKWQVPPKLHQLIDIFPKLSRLEGNESTKMKCLFSPTKEMRYAHHIQVFVRSIQQAATNLQNEDAITYSNLISKEADEDLRPMPLKLIGTGTTGAIAFDPSDLAFDTILVNSSSELPISIVNSSDCDLKYEIQVLIDEQMSVVNKQPGFGGNNDIHSDGHEHPNRSTYLSFSKPTGLLPARSHMKVMATFSPSESGKFVFAVNCQVHIVNEDGKPLYQSPLISDSSTQSLQCRISGSASFPTLLVKDVYVPNRSAFDIWRQLNLPKLNAFLAAPLTIEELRLNTHSTPDFNALQMFPIDFTPAPEGTPAETILFELQNPGSLTVEFKIRFPNESEVEIEQWADTGEPSADELRQNIIIDQKLFVCSPRSGTVGPNGSVTLSLTYSHSSNQFDGVHILPIVLQVDKGKQLVLELNGRTLHADEPLLSFGHPVRSLSPVHIGCKTAPIQRTQLYNHGDSALHFAIQADGPLDQLMQENYGYRILECLDPTGSIAPNSSFAVRWKFAPIEAKVYKCEFDVTYQGVSHAVCRDTQSLTILASGYHPEHHTFKEQRQSALAYGPPSQQLYIPADQIAYLGTNFLDFGHIPTKATQHRIVVLKNSVCDSTGVASTEPIMYRWDESHPLIMNGLVTFTPSYGCLAPNEHVVIRIAVAATAETQVLDEDFQCVVHPPSSITGETVAVRKRRMTSGSQSASSSSMGRSNKEEAKRQNLRKRPSNLSSQSAGGLRRQNSTMSTGSTRNDPLGSNISGGATTPSSIGTSKQRGLKSRSVSRSSFPDTEGEAAICLHLHIFAQVLEQEDYRRYYNHEALEKSMLHPTYFDPIRTTTLDQDTLQMQTLIDKQFGQDKRQRDDCNLVLCDVLANIMHDVVASIDVDQALKALPAKAQTPYFKQFTAAKSTPEDLRPTEPTKEINARPGLSAIAFGDLRKLDV